MKKRVGEQKKGWKEDCYNFKYCYSRLIDFTESAYGEEEEPEWRGYFYAVLMYLAAQLQSFVLAQYFKKMYVIGLQMRTGVISAVYRKVGFSCFVIASHIFFLTNKLPFSEL